MEPVPGSSTSSNATFKYPANDDELFRLLDQFASDVDDDLDGAPEDTDRTEADEFDDPDPIEQQMRNLFDEDPVSALEETQKVVEGWFDGNDSNVTKFPFTKSNTFLGSNMLTGNEPIDFFNLYFTKEFLELIVNETNDYAETVFLATGVRECSRITAWKPVNIEELKVFLGLLFHTGTIKASRISDYWKRAPLFNLGFGAYMSRNRFFLIMRCLHYSKNSKQKEKEDRLYKIRPIIDHFNDRNKLLYYPSRNLCIDESVMLWRGRLFFRVYIKNKRHKYGVKFYLLTEPNGFILRSIVYSGKSDDLGGVGHGGKIVMALMQDFKNSGHSLFMDNYYNSVHLSQKLSENKINCTGTMRKDNKEIPKEIKLKNLKKGEIIQKFNSQGTCLGKWKDKRNVMMISTETTMENCEVTTKRQTIVQKPSAVALYAQFFTHYN